MNMLLNKLFYDVTILLNNKKVSLYWMVFLSVIKNMEILFRLPEHKIWVTIDQICLNRK